MTSRPRQPAGKTTRKSPAAAGRTSGRHPDAERTVVRFTDAALSDLQSMVRKGDPQVVRWALKKCLLLERDPEAGEALRGALIGYRKLVVGNRNWRIVWRITHDDAGRPVVDVAEVWALGARSDSEVYAEMTARVATLSATSATVPLAEAIERLGRAAAGIQPASAEPATGPADDGTGADVAPGLPSWLVQSLIKVVGLPPAEVAQLTDAGAHRRWDEFITTSH
ncbi:type II toxin-antitoxin system RelE/ParE family toxin [uncultured Modestobacter sp.]|uniref:type II toxin-antitoxin system RelE family toxin n=1 Tax=uncultured Modestobacter sp. TaxID=380048 RepID=UPI002608732D|nr:type II toxin-antitoxin system RelE/ParE family toxin [uncultured Modestobacter sp.]